MSFSATNPPQVVRNEITKVFTADTFGKRALNPGKEFYYPVLDIGKPEDVQWAGVSTLNAIINSVNRTDFGSILTDNIDKKTGTLNEANYLLECAQFDEGAVKLSQLEAEIMRITDVNLALFEAATADGVTPEVEMENQGKIMANNALIRPLRIQYKAISEKSKAAAATRKANKEAEEAKAKENTPVAQAA